MLSWSYHLLAPPVLIFLQAIYYSRVHLKKWQKWASSFDCTPLPAVDRQASSSRKVSFCTAHSNLLGMSPVAKVSPPHKMCCNAFSIHVYPRCVNTAFCLDWCKYSNCLSQRATSVQSAWTIRAATTHHGQSNTMESTDFILMGSWGEYNHKCIRSCMPGFDIGDLRVNRLCCRRQSSSESPVARLMPPAVLVFSGSPTWGMVSASTWLREKLGLCLTSNVNFCSRSHQHPIHGSKYNLFRAQWTALQTTKTAKC